MVRFIRLLLNEKGRFLWSAHRITERQKAGKARSIKGKQLKNSRTKDLDLVVLENVGNLVCPAEFDTGAVKNAMILSVPEGHDKPLKYPLIFTVCDALIINKIDVLPYFDFDMEKVVEYAHMRNPKLKIFPLSAKTGEGVDAWCNWLREQVRAWNG